MDRMSPISKADSGLGPLKTSQIDKTQNRNVGVDINAQEEGDYVVYFINENTLGQSPILKLKVGDKFVIDAIIDSGSEVNLISHDLYDKLTKAGTKLLLLPVESVVLVTAFGRRSDRIKIQVYLEFTIGTDRFEHVFMVSSQLKEDAIVGCQFLKEFGVCIDFSKGAIRYVCNGVEREHEFVTRFKTHSVTSEGCDKVKAIVLSKTPSTTQQPQTQITECDDLIPREAVTNCVDPSHSQTRAVVKEGTRICDDASLSLSMLCGKTLSSSGGDDNLELRGANRDYVIDVGAPDTEISERLNAQSRSSVDRAADGSIHWRVNVVKKDLPGPEPSTHPEQSPPDPRSLRSEDVYKLVEQVSSLNVEQRQKLSSVLLKYLDFMTTKPGLCTLLNYKFQVVSDQPIVSFSRPIPFAQRPAIQELINQMMSDGILEICNSEILNPLTVVKKDDGKIRMCVDARKINQVTIPDFERVSPIRELLQKFYGARYLTSLDLSSAFHQIELHEESRPFTAFLFNGTVYRFRRVPYGFKNSLPAFIRAIKLALGGSDQTNVVFYVDDILIYSKTFDEHMMHIDAVLGKNLCRISKSG